MDRQRRNRGVVRATTTRLITSATEALQLENPSPADLQVILDDLQDKDTMLADLNKKIADLMTDGAEYEEELIAALEYHDKICHTMRQQELTLGTRLARSADAPPADVEQYESPAWHQQSEEAQPEREQQQAEREKPAQLKYGQLRRKQEKHVVGQTTQRLNELDGSLVRFLNPQPESGTDADSVFRRREVCVQNG
ncbi:hypothetical protein MTO96_049637 [Rhipicephalus appendiculatus]